MNVNMPVFNPAMPVTTNPVMPAPTDRQGGGSTAVATETSNPVLDAQEAQPGNPNPGQNAPMNAQEAGAQAPAARNDAAMASEVRFQMAREGGQTPQGFGMDPANLNQPATNATAQATMNEAQAEPQAQDNLAGTLNAEQTALQQRLEDRFEQAIGVANPQPQSQNILNETV